MSEVKLHETLNAAVWAKEFCKRWPSALCAIPGKEGVQDGEEFEETMIGWFANAIMAGVDSVTAERDALKSAQIDAIRAALEAAHDAIADYPRAAPDEAEWMRYDEQIEHSQHVLRALDPAQIARSI